MEVLKFKYLGKSHYARYQYNFKTNPSQVIVFIVYPMDDEIEFILGESKVFTFNKGKGGLMQWDCPDNSKASKILCEAVSEALKKTIQLMSF